MIDESAGHKTLSVEIEPFGPTPDDFNRIAEAVQRSDALRAAVAGGAHRLLTLEAIDPDANGRKAEQPQPPTRFRAAVYDYAQERALVGEADLAAPERVAFSESEVQPPVSDEEFRAAVEIVRADASLTAEGNGDLEFYRPMPPLLSEQGGPRRVTVGLFSRKRRRPIEIVGVNIAGRTLERFDGGAPPETRPLNNSICGAPVDAGQPTSAKGTTGQAWVTVKQGSTTLWRFLAVRPAASSGLRGSGIELRYVDYRGRRVLYRGHVPILNVKYDGDACGPYRDWQYQEGQIKANGTDKAPGFRLCPSPAETIMDTGSDTGNFLGVGVYVSGNEVVLVSEMEAGWYRYVSEWRLHANGTIRPRFGFAATESPCVCNVHHHHAYWRLDFDIRSASQNRVREYNRFLFFGWWRRLGYEAARPRSKFWRRRWRVEHMPSGAAYEIRPGAGDGMASRAPDAPYGRGDLWFVRYHPDEIDDGVTWTSGPNTEADIGKWVNKETLTRRDTVVWYGAHFSHDLSQADSAQHGHILGPNLVPLKWSD